jgi:hypothetical protein
MAESCLQRQPSFASKAFFLCNPFRKVVYSAGDALCPYPFAWNKLVPGAFFWGDGTERAYRDNE